MCGVKLTISIIRIHLCPARGRKPSLISRRISIIRRIHLCPARGRKLFRRRFEDLSKELNPSMPRKGTETEKHEFQLQLYRIESIYAPQGDNPAKQKSSIYRFCTVYAAFYKGCVQQSNSPLKMPTTAPPMPPTRPPIIPPGMPSRSCPMSEPSSAPSPMQARIVSSTSLRVRRR